MQLRDYQQEAHDAVVRWARSSLQPIVVDAATGAGKSYLIAALAKTFHGLSGGKGVLCLAPSRELVLQNVEKYRATGNPASIYSASAGEKCTRYPVTFGTPISVRNGIRAFEGKISVVVIDECHGISPTVRNLIKRLRDTNPNLRVVGLTATPYRLGQGFIYRQDSERSHGPETAKEPYFQQCVYRVHARELIDRGFLAEPVIGGTGDSYAASDLQLNSQHRFDSKEVADVFEGKRLTATIMQEIVEKSEGRRGVMVFATSIAHAQECLEQLPPADSAIVTGETKQKERAELLLRFKAQELKFLVNVQVLTTGFDASHVDLIAILRPTESVGLLQQIVGRGLRMHEGKKDCLVLDYAKNIERHCPDGDIFDPRIKATSNKKGKLIDAECPTCGTVNEFVANEYAKQYDLDEYGYCLDAAGQRIPTEFDPEQDVPGHHGRRCQFRNNRDEQCSYRWTYRTCRKCETENDITARHCSACGDELIDPNKKLRLGNINIKDPHKPQTEELLYVEHRDHISKKGNHCVLATFRTQTRSFRVYFHPESKSPTAVARYLEFKDQCMNGHQPHAVTYRKNQRGYYETLGYLR